MFFGDVPYKTNAGSVVDPNHGLINFKNRAWDQTLLGFVYFLLCILFTLVLLFNGCGCIPSLKKLRYLETVPVNEELGDYFSILFGLKQKAWFSHENFIREDLKKSTCSMQAFELLRTSKSPEGGKHRLAGI